MLHWSRTGEEFWNERKEKIINWYVNDNWSGDKIGNEIGCAGSTILYKLKEWNIPRHERYNNIYSFNDHYFDCIDTEHKAYWIGYILADGHISKDNTLMFGCYDKDIIEKAKIDLEIPKAIVEKPNKNNKHTIYQISINSKHLKEVLYDMGFTHNKSYEMDFKRITSYIPDELILHFIRGMFDGDGSIQYYNYNYVYGYQYHFGYTGLYNVCEYVAKHLCIKSKIIKERGDIAYTTRTANAGLIKSIYYKLYDNATIYCERKYQTFNKVLKLIDEENKAHVLGVSKYNFTKAETWHAQINKNDKHINIGYFKTKKEAEIARLQYEYDNYGDDAPQSYLFKEYGIGEKVG